jgi:hypothetical protein
LGARRALPGAGRPGTAVAEQDLQKQGAAPHDGLGTAFALFATVLFFLGLAAYLYWHGTGKLPWQ